MLVIHPADTSTDFLQALYDGQEGIRLLRGNESRNQVNDILFHLPSREPVMLLGHGSDAGLFRKQDGAYSLYIGRSMAYCLRKHPVIGIWCHAYLFAEQLRLHGLFSGMIVSEMDEAREYAMKTSEEELERENQLFATNLASLLRAGIPIPEIPGEMRALIQDGPEVRDFNYRSLSII